MAGNDGNKGGSQGNGRTGRTGGKSRTSGGGDPHRRSAKNEVYRLDRHINRKA